MQLKMCSEQLCVCCWGSNSSGIVGCQRTVNSMQLKLCSEQLCLCWWVSNTSGNVGCQRTVNSMQLKLYSGLLCVCVGGAATAVGMMVVTEQ